MGNTDKREAEVTISSMQIFKRQQSGYDHTSWSLNREMRSHGDKVAHDVFSNSLRVCHIGVSHWCGVTRRDVKMAIDIFGISC